jgi:hypothetical protein
VVGMRVADVQPMHAIQGVIGQLRKVVATGEPFVGRELPLTYEGSHGEPAKTSYLDYVFLPLRKANGEILRDQRPGLRRNRQGTLPPGDRDGA